MQEVFTRIIEKLEKLGNIQFSSFTKPLITVEDAIKIVSEVEAEYNNGWIPCSERLPEAESLHEKSIDECTGYLIQRRCGVMDVAKYIKVYGEPHFSANALSVKDVIAWQPLPEPYQKGE